MDSKDKLKKAMRIAGDRDILSDEIMKCPDRDILAIVLECYTNLNDTYLAAYSINVARPENEFAMKWKEHLQKIKNKNEPTGEVLDKRILEVTDVTNLSNAFYEIKLKYIMNPNLVNNDFKISAIDNTIANFKEMTKDYQYKNNILIDELKRIRGFYENNAIIKNKYGINDDKESRNDLFVKEQSILLPMLHKTRKYKIDGHSYYGVWNDSVGCSITSGGRFSCKTTRRGKSFTFFMDIVENPLVPEKEVLEVAIYGHARNPFHFLKMLRKPLIEMEMEKIIPLTGVASFDEILKNTWEQALEMERLDIVPTGDVQPAQLGEDGFVSKFGQYIKEFALRRNNEVVQKYENHEREFVHLAALDIEIYGSINNSRRKVNGKKKFKPSELVKRKNLSSVNVYTTIKQGYATNDNKEVTQMFESSLTSPNPIDIYKMLQYIKVPQHTETKDKPKAYGAKTTNNLSMQLIKKDNLKYLGTFAPKNAADMEASAILHPHMDEKYIIYRDEKFKKVFISNDTNAE